MSRSHIFPYGITLRDGGMVDVFPAAEIFFLSKNGEWISLFFVIDSGATTSALPKNDAKSFGIHAEVGIPTSIRGIGDIVLNGWKQIEL